MSRMNSGLIAAVVAAAGGTAASAASLTVASYGTTQDGHPIKAYTLTNDRGSSATILDYGGAIAQIRVPDRTGKLGNVVLSFADLAQWEQVGHANSIIGRYANRIRGGFTLDGTHYPLKQDAKGVTLHGGQDPYSKRVWTARPVKGGPGVAVMLTGDSPDGDQGFPGDLKIKVTYRLTNDNALRLDFVATTDKPTLVNLTNHIYFNLNGNGTTPIYTHDLQVMADKVQAKDADNLPTGELVPVAGTPYDFTRPVVLGERIVPPPEIAPGAAPGAPAPPPPPGKVTGYDHSMVIRPGYNRLDRVAARLHDPTSGRVMALSTTETSVQLFTPARERPELMSEAGLPFASPGPAVALETQHLPDSPNHPDFPSTVLRPGQTYHSTTIFRFTTDLRPAGRRVRAGQLRKP